MLAMVMVIQALLQQLFYWRRAKYIIRGGHSIRLGQKVTVNQTFSEAVQMSASVNPIKRLKKRG
jgi:hypothetical protein